MIAPVDQLARELRLFRPIDLVEAAIEGGLVIAAVELVLALEGRDGGDLVRHLLFRYEIAAAERHAVEAEVLRHHVEQALAEKIGLEAARPAISADRRLVGQLQRNVDVDVGDAVGPRHELRDIAGADGAVRSHIGADVIPPRARD